MIRLAAGLFSASTEPLFELSPPFRSLSFLPPACTNRLPNLRTQLRLSWSPHSLGASSDLPDSCLSSTSHFWCPGHCLFDSPTRFSAGPDISARFLFRPLLSSFAEPFDFLPMTGSHLSQFQPATPKLSCPLRPTPLRSARSSLHA
jgi:hypothetical protein